ncbi:single-stranded DNA-binding protein [Formicincola oecophyllae]|uniref:Single-stranded DNA-binding protein n=1 Tax=Formicincola oecophyllae TaxID=2558361 RepID=A0A4Y6UAU8_9PROT|nr:single-stranded DNA-binding protein [Formicincola oecophyllae]QDH13586.1 single-stranded DNA-binding protein [Formicincola oecophyllae]
MAGSVNKVILVGNLGADPEIRNTQSGSKIANLRLATSQSWNDRNTGERQERTEWHRVVLFNERLADVAERFLRKGRKVYVEGELRTRKWTDQSGQDKYTTEVVIDRFRGDLQILDNNRDGDSQSGGGYGAGQASQGGGYQKPRAQGSSFGGQSQSRPQAQGGNQGWDAGHAQADQDLDDEIPF